MPCQRSEWEYEINLKFFITHCERRDCFWLQFTFHTVKAEDEETPLFGKICRAFTPIPAAAATVHCADIIPLIDGRLRRDDNNASTPKTRSLNSSRATQEPQKQKTKEPWQAVTKLLAWTMSSR